MNATPNTIYAARAAVEGGLYKFGATSNLVRRFRHICNASPVDMELIGSMIGDCHLERRIHASLLEWHVRCEWFEPSEPVRQMARNIAAGTVQIDDLPAPIGVTSFVRGKPRVSA